MTRRRSVTADERRLWCAAMHGTDPMPGRKLPLIAPSPSEPAALAPAAAGAIAPPPRKALANVGGDGLQARDLDRRTAERFRRGRMELDGRIDLHGMTQAQAHGALAAFVHRAWLQGRRCLLVITGKGGFTGGGVLRHAAPRWLAEPVLARMILGVETAMPKDGGDGALYVLIRRRRDERGRDERRRDDR